MTSVMFHGKHNAIISVVCVTQAAFAACCAPVAARVAIYVKYATIFLTQYVNYLFPVKHPLNMFPVKH